MKNVLNVKSLELAKIHTDKNVSDMLTKAVKMEKHVFCRDGMLLGDPSFHVETKLTLKILWVAQGTRDRIVALGCEEFHAMMQKVDWLTCYLCQGARFICAKAQGLFSVHKDVTCCSKAQVFLMVDICGTPRGKKVHNKARLANLF